MSIQSYGRIVTTIATLFLLGLFTTAHAHADTFWAGDLSVSNVFGKPTPKGADIAHVALVISNVSEDGDVLIAVDVPPAVADAAGLDSLPLSVYRGANLRRSQPVFIRGGETRQLGYDGVHLVLYGIQGPFMRGLQVPVRLTFQKAGVVDVIVDVGGDTFYQASSSPRDARLVRINFEPQPTAQAINDEPAAGKEFACSDGSKMVLGFGAQGGIDALVTIHGQAYRLAAQPPPSGEVRILWSDGPHSLTWSPGVRLMWMSGSTHLMCGRSSHHH